MKKIFIAIVLLCSLIAKAQTDSLSIGTHRLISDISVNFNYTLEYQSGFYNTATIGDIDNNGVRDLIVGAPFERYKKGNLYTVLLNADLTVKSVNKLIDSSLQTQIDFDDRFGAGIINIGDINKDGFDDIACGANNDDDSLSNAGALYILFLNNKAEVIDYSKISVKQGLSGLNTNAFLGSHQSIQLLGDVNNDGINDIIASVYKENGNGKLLVICLNEEGKVKNQITIDDDKLGFSMVTGYDYGISIANLGDINKDGVQDLAISTKSDNNYGVIYTLLMNSDWTVKSSTKITKDSGGFTGDIGLDNNFGMSVINAGDLNNDGITDIIANSFDDKGGENIGSAWILYLNENGTVKSHNKISGKHFSEVETEDYFGYYIKNLGDLNNDGKIEYSFATLYGDGKVDNNGGFYLTNLNELKSISGSVYAGSTLTKELELDLYLFEGNDSIKVETITTNEGAFMFDYIVQGDYKIVAKPDTNVYIGYYETISSEINLGKDYINNLEIKLTTVRTSYTELENEITVFPIPSSNYITIKNNLSGIELNDIKVINLIGIQSNVEINKEGLDFRLDISNLETGVYFININSLNKYIKFIKE
ncbi:MAG: FG-GAP repeat protein [Bacteroidales bacterium]|nr:FG-GAP repeat protein [Bacteroidales bacterium]